MTSWRVVVRRRLLAQERAHKLERKWQAWLAQKHCHPSFEEVPDFERMRVQVRDTFTFWHRVAAPNATWHRNLRAAMLHLGARIVRSQRQWLNRWREHTAFDRVRKARMVNILKQFPTVAGRKKQRGLDAFAMRAPRWETVSENVELRARRAKLVHRLQRGRSGAIGSPVVRDGQIYRFGFIVGGGGSGVVLGITDAPISATADERLNATVWGICLTHGCLYTKKGVQRAKLGNKNITPPLSELRMQHRTVLRVEVEVDRESHRLAFSVGGSALSQVPDFVLPSSTPLRPWAFLWNVNDRVVLVPRPNARQPTMAPARERVSLHNRPLPSPKSNRTLTTPPQSHRSSLSLSSYRVSPVPTSHRPSARSPIASTSPPRSPTYLRDRPSMRSSHPPHAAEADMPLSPTSYFGSPHERMSRHATAVAAFDAGHEGALPLPAAPLTPAQQKSVAQPHLFDFSLGIFNDDRQQRQSPRDQKRSHPWDIMKHVTSLYSDVYQHLR